MKLIVAQMRNLNPMDPSSGGDGLATMMQVESLNQLTVLNRTLTAMTTITQTSNAAALLGRSVSGLNSSGQSVTGKVTGIRMDSSGPILELAGGATMRFSDMGHVSAT
jgi:flagellar basal-body rod modification protein FlgD